MRFGHASCLVWRLATKCIYASKDNPNSAGYEYKARLDDMPLLYITRKYIVRPDKLSGLMHYLITMYPITPRNIYKANHRTKKTEQKLLKLNGVSNILTPKKKTTPTASSPTPRR